MPVALVSNIKRFEGFSSDIKPGIERQRDDEGTPTPLQIPPVGSTFLECDTGKRFVWMGSWPWVSLGGLATEAAMAELIETNQEMTEQLAQLIIGLGEHLDHLGIETDMKS